ncbi:DUF2795 domain-containing protein [Actinophytocola oryzae]|uniref:Uncharacterized protein DUF2795 n=1 Tax=Actinophytocola oryzae TaxID=502181 RepID=A0A4V3FQ66_9PSEU|nr:DUF2795 domain-containing protein [Actinophytocola oryzae]TDV36027.1 uncharacterized protein DUF2795 [Actinophytocola oryzae]
MTSEQELDNEKVVRQVLGDLPFPAFRWQLIAQAAVYGADSVTMGKLHRLPVRRYADREEVTAAIIAAQHVRPRPRRYRRMVIPMNVRHRPLVVAVAAPD